MCFPALNRLYFLQRNIVIIISFLYQERKQFRHWRTILEQLNKMYQTLNIPSPLPNDTWKIPFLLPTVMIMISAGVGWGDTWMARLGQKSSIVTEILHASRMLKQCASLGQTFLWLTNDVIHIPCKIKLSITLWVFEQSIRKRSSRKYLLTSRTNPELKSVTIPSIKTT